MDVLKTVFPRLSLSTQCLLCHCQTDCEGNLCSFCIAQLPWIQTHCQRCALPMAQNGLCGSCLTRQPPYHRCISAFLYEPPIAQLIHQFKDNGNLTAGRTLADLLGQKLANNISTVPDFLLPVPLHYRRQFLRGFNQSLDLALTLSQKLQLPCEESLVRKIRNTSPQHNLDRKQRIKNLNGAFALKPRARQKIVGMHIALVDDVVTTGTTVRTLAKVLLKAGASKVDVWCIARTPLS